MYCIQCGEKLEDDAKFCPACGTKVARGGSDEKEHEAKGNSKILNPPTKSVEQDKEEAKEREDVPATPIKEQEAREEAPEQPKVYVPDKDLVQMFVLTDNSSRLNRLRYFKRGLCINIAYTLLEMFVPKNLSTEAVVALIVAIILLISVQYSLDVRRLKDLGKGEGLASFRRGSVVVGYIHLFWWYNEVIVVLSNIVGCLIGLYLLFAPGDKGPNQYGPDPLGPTEKQ